MPIVVTSGSSEVALEDLKRHLNIEDDDQSEDVELEFFLAAATAWIGTQVDDVSPTPVQLATMELVRHWWRISQLGPANIPEPDDDIGLIGLRVPPFVHEMLGPYLTGASGIAPPAPTGSFPDALDWPDQVCW